MKKFWLIGVGVLLILMALVAFSCVPVGTVSGPSGGNAPAPFAGASLSINGGQQQGLWVNGLGQVQAVPDIASLSLGVQAQAGTVAEAQSQAVNAMNGIMAALKSNGVADKDIRTQNFNIQQLTRYDNNKQQSIVIGYQVTNTVVAKIRAMDKVGPVIDAAVKAGGDAARVNSISFSVDDPTKYTNDARDKAMADAKAKADQMAAAAGIKLGKPTYITESSYQPPPTPIMRAEAVPAPAMQTPISPGELTIQVNVQIVYPIIG